MFLYSAVIFSPILWVHAHGVSIISTRTWAQAHGVSIRILTFAFYGRIIKSQIMDHVITFY